MIDWDKAPEGATHAVTEYRAAVTWAKMVCEQPIMLWCSNDMRWIPASITILGGGLSGRGLMARPTPRTETDDLLNLIRAQKDKAYQMGCAQAVAYINQQEKQS